MDQEGNAVAVPSNGTLRTARRLLALGAFAPPLLLTAYQVWHATRDGGTFSSDDLLMVGGILVGLSLLGLWPFRGSRNDPQTWPSVGAPGVFAIGLIVATTELGADGDGTVQLVAGATVLVIATIAFLLPFRARKMVLSRLMRDVVDSSLIIKFRGRDKGDYVLAVGPDALAIYDDGGGSDRFHRPYRLADVESVAVWTESDHTEWAIPGEDEQALALPPGEVVGITLPGGVLVFDAAEPQKLRQFVEARMRRQASLVEE